MFIEIAHGLRPCLSSACHFMIFFPLKIGKVVDGRKNHPSLTSDVNVTLHQTNDLLAKVNVFNG